MRELGLERVGVGLGREVVMADRADRVREPLYHLTHARLTCVLVPVQPCLAEVFGDEDVGGELAPACRDFGTLHLEDDAAVRVGDGAGPTLVPDGLEGVFAGGGEATLNVHTAGRTMFGGSALFRRRLHARSPASFGRGFLLLRR